MIQVGEQEFQKIAHRRTVIHKGPANGTNVYITDGGDGFYYKHLGKPGLEFQHSKVIKAEYIESEERTRFP